VLGVVGGVLGRDWWLVRQVGRRQARMLRELPTVVGAWTPGADAHYGWRGDDRAHSVVTVRGGRIVAMRDCRDRQEALRLAGIQSRAPAWSCTATPAPGTGAARRRGSQATGSGRPRPVFAVIDSNLKRGFVNRD
jgi:hypothetical protein